MKPSNRDTQIVINQTIFFLSLGLYISVKLYGPGAEAIHMFPYVAWPLILVYMATMTLHLIHYVRRQNKEIQAEEQPHHH